MNSDQVSICVRVLGDIVTDNGEPLVVHTRRTADPGTENTVSLSEFADRYWLISDTEGLIAPPAASLKSARLMWSHIYLVDSRTISIEAAEPATQCEKKLVVCADDGHAITINKKRYAVSNGKLMAAGDRLRLVTSRRRRRSTGGRGGRS